MVRDLPPNVVAVGNPCSSHPDLRGVIGPRASHKQARPRIDYLILQDAEDSTMSDPN